METENSGQNTFSRKDSSNENNEQKKENQQNSNNQNAGTGFDFSKLLDDKNLVEILKHLLAGGGAMGGTYLIWIKPLQDKIAEMNAKITEQDKQIRELEEEQRELLRTLNDERESHHGKAKSQDYFNINRGYTNKDFEREREMRKWRSKYL